MTLAYFFRTCLGRILAIVLVVVIVGLLLNWLWG